MKKARIINTVFICCLLFQTSCRKFVQTEPPVTSVTGADVFTSNATAAAVLTGMYTNLSSNSLNFATGINSLSVLGGLSADELTLYSGETSTNLVAYYINALGINTGGAECWESIYPFIYICNAAIEGLTNASALNQSVQKQALGEAKFMRAFFYFYLVNLYGDVPMPLTTDYTVNESLPGTPSAQVYRQVIADLTDAESLLNSNYVDGTLLNASSQRVRPTTWAAAALLARAYLYTQKWDSAETAATMVINNSAEYSLDTLNGVFLANSTEAIWQLQPVDPSITNTIDAQVFIIPSTGPNSSSWPVWMSNFLLSGFEAGDLRRVDWVDSVSVGSVTYYFPYKYKVNALNSPVAEYLMVLRLGEQYLIRAEARAEQGNVSGSAGDLNIIRNRAGLPNTLAGTQGSLLTAIQHERQVELFTEWGNRWLDLKRTGSVDSVMTIVTPQKANGSPWQSYQQLYPFYNADILSDRNLVQNPGYN